MKKTIFVELANITEFENAAPKLTDSLNRLVRGKDYIFKLSVGSRLFQCVRIDDNIFINGYAIDMPKNGRGIDYEAANNDVYCYIHKQLRNTQSICADNNIPF